VNRAQAAEEDAAAQLDLVTAGHRAMQIIYDELVDPKYRPCPLLEEMVAAGHLGRKPRRSVYRH
jgi:3-hydroxyacyl-CoA dehydrogenase